MSEAPATFPVPMFRFHVDFKVQTLGDGDEGADRPLCNGVFSECTGLEATMEPRIIKEGGSNFGGAQRVGPVTFGTVVLKRGMTRSRDLWNWFAMVNNRRAYAYRLGVTITMYDIDGSAVLAWHLERALPVKFKASDLNARSAEVGIEELHLAHEGLTLAAPSRPRLD